MLEKTFSQKAARILEIAAYLLLVPATAWWFLSFILVIGVVASFRLEHFPYQIFDNLIPVIIPSLIYSLGVLLLTGYFKHSRGTLGENKIIPLWIGTFLYNLSPLLAVIYQIVVMPGDFQNIDFKQFLSPYAVLSLSLVLWWIIAVLLSAGAIYSELTKYKSLFGNSIFEVTPLS
jgi:hypothetical protein